jgi:competence protein ComGC
MVDSDQKFAAYKKDHRWMFCIISTLTALVSFKYNKIFYSYFYSFKMFRASWTEEQKYRKNMTWFTIVHMLIVDLGLIIIGVAGVLSLRFLQNQLWIIYCETVVLSIIDIVLSAIELYKLKEILSYTSTKKTAKRGNVASANVDSDEELSNRKKVGGLNQFYGEFDNESRQEMMAGLIYKVTANKNLFLNNKLDELLDMFGDRRCKSMIEFGTGWDKEEDPRRTVTIPMSPTLLMEKYNGEYKFTIDDMFGDLGDNCYAEERVRNIHDIAVQGD